MSDEVLLYCTQVYGCYDTITERIIHVGYFPSTFRDIFFPSEHMYTMFCLDKQRLAFKHVSF